MKQVVFLSGLPRTGSTVLASMLNQHPDIHATTTSPVADLVSLTMANWGGISGALKDPPPHQYGNILTGILHGAHSHISKDIVVDKNRLWPRYAAEWYAATGVKPKIICTVRSIPEIMASYILLMDRPNNRDNFVDSTVRNMGLTVNNKNRCRVLLEKYINHPYTSLKIGYNSGGADLLFVEYDSIIGEPGTTMERICSFLGCSSFTLDKDNLQSMEENDYFHGGMDGLHHIRSALGRTSPPPADVIGSALTQEYSGMKLEFWRKEKQGTVYTGISRPKVETFIPQQQPAPTQNSPELEGDSLDYDLLYRAAIEASGVDGLYCEIGVRRGGSLKYIIDAVHSTHEYKTIVAIDPYGNIDYNATQEFRGKLDYTNNMKNQSLPNIYRYAEDKGINLVFFNLEDTEFFNRFTDGVPVYNEVKQVINKYAFVFFDGPHDTRSLHDELDFFDGKIDPGAVYVFDDVGSYPHDEIHSRLINGGFQLLEIGSQGRKISYVYNKLNINRLH